MTRPNTPEDNKSHFGKHLKRLQWRTPFQAICEAWANDPAPFKINPHHLIPGPNT